MTSLSVFVIAEDSAASSDAPAVIAAQLEPQREFPLAIRRSARAAARLAADILRKRGLLDAVEMRGDLFQRLRVEVLPVEATKDRDP